MVEGTVKWFNARKGYGFLTPDGAEEGENNDIFVHFSNIEMEGFKSLYENDRVTFEVAEGEKGKEAKSVVVIEHAPRPPRRRRSDKAGEAEEGEAAPVDEPADVEDAESEDSSDEE